MTNTNFSAERQATYYVGTILQILGIFLFLSTFISIISNFRNFDNLEEHLGFADKKTVIKVGCQSCRSLNDESDNFCGNCGVKL